MFFARACRAGDQKYTVLYQTGSYCMSSKKNKTQAEQWQAITQMARCSPPSIPSELHSDTMWTQRGNTVNNRCA